MRAPRGEARHAHVNALLEVRQVRVGGLDELRLLAHRALRVGGAQEGVVALLVRAHRRELARRQLEARLLHRLAVELALQTHLLRVGAALGEAAQARREGRVHLRRLLPEGLAPRERGVPHGLPQRRLGHPAVHRPHARRGKVWLALKVLGQGEGPADELAAAVRALADAGHVERQGHHPALVDGAGDHLGQPALLLWAEAHDDVARRSRRKAASGGARGEVGHLVQGEVHGQLLVSIGDGHGGLHVVVELAGLRELHRGPRERHLRRNGHAGEHHVDGLARLEDGEALGHGEALGRARGLLRAGGPEASVGRQLLRRREGEGDDKGAERLDGAVRRLHGKHLVGDEAVDALVLGELLGLVIVGERGEAEGDEPRAVVHQRAGDRAVKARKDLAKLEVLGHEHALRVEHLYALHEHVAAEVDHGRAHAVRHVESGEPPYGPKGARIQGHLDNLRLARSDDALARQELKDGRVPQRRGGEVLAGLGVHHAHIEGEVSLALALVDHLDLPGRHIVVHHRAKFERRFKLELGARAEGVHGHPEDDAAHVHLEG
mmetsp:Transcript_18944/g.55610  ORF Transcript_18944/g.55610 Transcript_18944/m.55610 type:complete len:550 (-) Transcript_18944:294-1943(-)